MRRVAITGTLVAAGAILAGSISHSNDAAINQVGGSIHAMDEHPAIRLIAEQVTVDIDARSDQAAVTCFFVLKNEGPATDVRIGFPEDCDGDTGPRPFRTFHSHVDGIRLPARRLEATEGTGGGVRYWWVKSVSFAAGQTRILQEEYAGTPGSAADGSRFFRYVLHTGASWLGPIDVASIVVRLHGATGGIDGASPEPTERSATDCRWHFADFEPGEWRVPRSVWVRWRPEEQIALRAREAH